MNGRAFARPFSFTRGEDGAGGLEAAEERAMRTISEAHPVVAGPPWDRRAVAGDLRSPRWALETLGFDEARQKITPGGVPNRSAIAVIDSGNGALGHELFTRHRYGFEYIPPDEIARHGNLARPLEHGNGVHAAEVAGVIALAVAMHRGRLRETLNGTALLVARVDGVAAAIEHPAVNNKFPYAPAVALGAALVALGL